MSAEKPCQAELRDAFVCTQVTGPVECGACFDLDPDVFTTAFEDATREAYISTQAYASPSDPEFCGIANERTCMTWETTQSCCCQAETERYRRCLVETVFPQELPRPLAYETTTCLNVCGGATAEGGSESGSNTVIIAAAAGGVVVLIMAAVAFFYCRRRRAAATLALQVKHVEQKPEDIETGVATKTSEASTSSEGDSAIKHDELPKESTTYQKKSAPSKAAMEEQDREEPVKPKRQPSKSSMMDEQDDEEEPTEGLTKAQKLKKKRDAIENWNKERKAGSNRSLEDYLSDEDVLADGKDQNDRREGETKEERRQRRAERRSARKLLEEAEKADRPAEEDQSKLNDRQESPKKRSSSRSKLTTEESPADVPQREEQPLKSQRKLEKKSSSRRSTLEEEDVAPKRSSKEGDKKNGRSSSRDRLQDEKSSSRDLRREERRSNRDLKKSSSGRSLEN